MEDTPLARDRLDRYTKAFSTSTCLGRVNGFVVSQACKPCSRVQVVKRARDDTLARELYLFRSLRIGLRRR